MKKFLSIILIVLLAVCCFSGCEKQPKENPPEDFEFTENSDGTVTITGYIGTDVEVVVPQKINDKAVTAISNLTFVGNRNITYVSLPEGLEELEEDTFQRCESLTTVKLPNSIKTIGFMAFEYCVMLSDINLTDSITKIESRAFKGCSSLKHIDIKANIEYGEEVFMSSGIESFTIENGVETIAPYLLSDTNIETVELPKSVKTISTAAFSNCEYLSSVKLNEGLTTLQSRAFGGESRLKEIVLPATVTNINEMAFDYCYSLESVKFEGDAPQNYKYEPLDVYCSSYTVYYHSDAEGWTAPEWCGYKTAVW